MQDTGKKYSESEYFILYFKLRTNVRKKKWNIICYRERILMYGILLKSSIHLICCYTHLRLSKAIVGSDEFIKCIHYDTNLLSITLT